MNAAGDVTELVKAELDVAKRELRADLVAARESATLLGVATAFGVIGTEVVLGAFVAAGRRHPLALALVGFGFLGGSVALGAAALAAMPDVLAKSRARVTEDVVAIAAIQEGIA